MRSLHRGDGLLGCRIFPSGSLILSTATGHFAFTTRPVTPPNRWITAQPGSSSSAKGRSMVALILRRESALTPALIGPQDGGRAVQSGNWSCGTLPGSRTDNPGRPDWTRFVCPECAHRSVRTEPSIAYTEFRILLRSLNRPRILSITSSKSDGGSWPDFVWAS